MKSLVESSSSKKEKDKKEKKQQKKSPQVWLDALRARRKKCFAHQVTKTCTCQDIPVVRRIHPRKPSGGKGPLIFLSFSVLRLLCEIRKQATSNEPCKFHCCFCSVGSLVQYLWQSGIQGDSVVRWNWRNIGSFLDTPAS